MSTTKKHMAYPIIPENSIKGMEVEGVDDVISKKDITFKKVMETLESCKDGFEKKESEVFDNNGHKHKIIVISNPIRQGYHSLTITQVNITTGKKRNISLLVVSNCHSDK